MRNGSYLHNAAPLPPILYVLRTKAVAGTVLAVVERLETVRGAFWEGTAFDDPQQVGERPIWPDRGADGGFWRG